MMVKMRWWWRDGKVDQFIKNTEMLWRMMTKWILSFEKSFWILWKLLTNSIFQHILGNEIKCKFKNSELWNVAQQQNASRWMRFKSIFNEIFWWWKSILWKHRKQHKRHFHSSIVDLIWFNSISNFNSQRERSWGFSQLGKRTSVLNSNLIYFCNAIH